MSREYTYSPMFGYVVIISSVLVIVLFIHRCHGANHHSEATMIFIVI